MINAINNDQHNSDDNDVNDDVKAMMVEALAE